MKEESELDTYLLNNKGREICVSFDLGSKSARVLIGPRIEKKDLNNWNPFDWFFLDSEPIELLASVNIYTRRMNLQNNIRLDQTIYFINTYKKRLIKNGVPLNNFTLVGTEVFRDLINQKEVIAKLEQETGFQISILKKEAEAFLSLLALTHTYTYPSGDIDIPVLNKEGIILLFDQGGGSTEISYYELQGEQFGTQSSISQVGTTALREFFFNSGADGNEVAPEKSKNKISTQFNIIGRFVTNEIDKEFEKQATLKWLSRYSKKIIPFAMGSAIKTSIENLHYKKTGKRISGKRFNCKEISVNEIKEVLEENYSLVERGSDFVGQLYKEFSSLKGKERSLVEDKLLLFYGLPVYLKLLAKFKLNSIRYSYFNLKHGVFLVKYYYNLPDVNITSLPVKSDVALFDSRKRSEPLKVSIIYTWADGEGHKSWVRSLAEKLELVYDIKLTFDRDLNFGHPTRRFSEGLIKNADIVLIICTPFAVERATEPEGSFFGYEYDLAAEELKENVKRNEKYIPILRQGSKETSIPVPFDRLTYLDMRDDLMFDNSINIDFKKIFSGRSKAS